MQSKAKTVSQYLSELPPDRRKVIDAVRKVIRKNLSKGYEEGMQYGMIGYYVPHSEYPPGYHCDPKQPLPFGGVASQKNHMSLYLMCIYSDPEQQAWFRKAWAKTGKKLDMGKACIRFKKLDDLALDVIGEAVRQVPKKKFVEFYESVVVTMGKRSSRGSTRKSPTKSASKKTVSKKKAPRTTKARSKKTVKRRVASNKA